MRRRLQSGSPRRSPQGAHTGIVHHVPAQIESLGASCSSFPMPGASSAYCTVARNASRNSAPRPGRCVSYSDSELELDGSILEELEHVSDLGSSEGGLELRPSPPSWPRRARASRVARRRDGPRLVGPLPGLRRVRKALRRSTPDLRDRVERLFENLFDGPTHSRKVRQGARKLHPMRNPAAIRRADGLLMGGRAAIDMGRVTESALLLGVPAFQHPRSLRMGLGTLLGTHPPQRAFWAGCRVGAPEVDYQGGLACRKDSRRSVQA